MSDIKKWLEIMKEDVTINLSLNLADTQNDTRDISAVPAASSIEPPEPVPAPRASYGGQDMTPNFAVSKDRAKFSKDETVTISPTIGCGGTGRFVQYTKNGAIIDIKGSHRELSLNDFSSLENEYKNLLGKGNEWSHSTVEPDTIGRMNDKPEFRPGDMVKIDDVYGAAIGPGIGIFVAYSTGGNECILSFNDKEIIVPTSSVSAIQEQDAKDNFNQMDNDGNLSTLSLGSQNVKEEVVMDQKDEFSKWMSAVEEALSGEGKELAEDIPSTNECGCGNWDCAMCFPAQDEMPGMHGALDGIGGHNPEDTVVVGGMNLAEPAPGADQMDQFAAGIESDINDIEADSEFSDGLEEVSMFDEEDDDPVAAFKAAGGQVQELPYMNKPRNPGLAFGSKHIGSQTGQGSRGQQRGAGANVSIGRNSTSKPVVGEEEQDFTQVEKPRSGKGVKLGDIVTKTEFKKTGGEESPLSYGDDNLDEGPDMVDDIDQDAAMEMISTIKYMQSMGLSNAQREFGEDELAAMSGDELKQVHNMVTGEVAEATAAMEPEDEPAPKPFKTKTRNPLDDLDDVLNPRDAQPLANIPGPEDDGDTAVADDPSMSLPAASRNTTQDRTRNMSPSDTMRDYMSRINPEAGATEPELPDTPANELVLRTASDVPAVISSAMQASGMQSPEWHHVRNLPGYDDRNTRGMGRSVFSMFTSTPIEQIQTIANVEGQGPNTDAEMRAVAGWLRDNAEDMGHVEVSHGMAIPGYKPDVREFRANGIRFHVVRDPMGQYIYAYPDADARLQGPAGQGQGRVAGGRNTPRLGESTEGEDMKLIGRPTLFEQLKWDEEINTLLKESVIEEDELEESTLSKKIGKQKGGQRLVQWLHRKHKLGNEAELTPAPFSERLLWKEFKSNPDNFVIVSAEGGVAGVKPHEEFIKKRTEEFRKKGKDYNPAGDSTLPYQIIAFTDDGEQVDPNLLRQPTVPGEEPEERHPDPTVMKARMGKISGKDMQNPNNTFNLLADQIGALRTVWVASGAIERDKMKGRADLKKSSELSEMDAVKKIFKRVRPVLKTLGNQALSQINNRAKRYIDGGNFEAAQKVAQSGHRLKQFLTTIDTTGDVSLDTSYGSRTKPFTDNIIMAVVKASGARQGTDEYKDFLNRAANGSAIELKPVLDSLRDSLVELA